MDSVAAGCMATLVDLEAAPLSDGCHWCSRLAASGVASHARVARNLGHLFWLPLIVLNGVA